MSNKIDKSIKNLIKAVQEEYGEKYEIKSRQDKLTCIICNGKYTRQCRTTHIKSQKHAIRENKIIEDIKRELLYYVKPKNKKDDFMIEMSKYKSPLKKAMEQFDELLAKEKKLKEKPKEDKFIEELVKEIENVDLNNVELSEDSLDEIFEIDLNEPYIENFNNSEILVREPIIKDRKTLSDSYLFNK